MVNWTQVSQTRNGFVHPHEGRKCSTEGTGLQSLLLWRKQMTKVTYRGVEYNAEEYNAKVLAEASQRNRHELMYRGIKVKSKASPCS